MNLRLKNPEILFYLTHCNYWHMICAISGMVYQMLVNKNMPMGKRYSHVLRMKDMYEAFLDNSMTEEVEKIGKFQVEKLQKELFDLYLRKILFDVC